ncbi:MAG: hypothetical protein LQ351_000273 [Letrouitia transgressa]|nr:MAG: hypothetical protein LQ351_000273 [Letrouitia transgressa]
MTWPTSHFGIQSQSDSPKAQSTGALLPDSRLQQRRRHSSHHSSRKLSYDLDADAIFMKVDLFVSELERRLDWIESDGNLDLDNGIACAYSTLEAVRDSCSHVSGELIGAGKRRAKILVETMEDRYNHVLATRESLEAKAQLGMRLMESFLSELEARVHAVHDRGFSHIVDEGWRIAEEGLGRAREVVDEGLEKARRLKDSVENAINRAKEHGLIRYEDLPHPWRVNPHIVRGYRFSESKFDCVRSAFNVSNELVNIWSHAIGLLVVLSIAFHFYPSSVNFSQSSKTDIFFAAMFFFAACKCLVCSCMWHTMSSIAEQSLMERFACVDYTGISLLIAASIITTEYTAFYCEPTSQWAYILLTATLGICGVLLPWHPTFNRADMKWSRVLFYISLAATGFGPILQTSLIKGPAWSYYFYAPIAKSILVYLAGALIYASQVPERWLHGWFDYFGGSHNIWHVAVLGGILYHYAAMQKFFSFAFERAHECSL